MRQWRNVFFVSIFFCLLIGCGTHRANRDRIVLLSDPEGKGGFIRDRIVLLSDSEGKGGVITVTTKGGSQTLDKPGYAIEIEDPNRPPNAPQPVNEKEV